MSKRLVFCKNSAKLTASKKFKTFSGNMEILIKNSEISETVYWFKIPFLRNPTQEKVSQIPNKGYVSDTASD